MRVDFGPKCFLSWFLYIDDGQKGHLHPERFCVQSVALLCGRWSQCRNKLSWVPFHRERECGALRHGYHSTVVVDSSSSCGVFHWPSSTFVILCTRRVRTVHLCAPPTKGLLSASSTFARYNTRVRVGYASWIRGSVFVQRPTWLLRLSFAAGRAIFCVFRHYLCVVHLLTARY